MVIDRTIWIIVLANMIHFYSVPFTTATTALKRLDREFETVSESLAVPFYKTLRKMTTSSVSAGDLGNVHLFFLFVNSLVTVSAVVFLYARDSKNRCGGDCQYGGRRTNCAGSG